MIIGVTGRGSSVLICWLHKKSSLLGASLCDVTDFATEAVSSFSFKLLLQLCSQFGDLLLNESVDLHASCQRRVKFVGILLQASCQRNQILKGRRYQQAGEGLVP